MKPEIMITVIIIVELIIILYLLSFFLTSISFVGKVVAGVLNTTLEDELPTYWPVSLIIPVITLNLGLS